VRRYLRSRLSRAGVAELLAERGEAIHPSAVSRARASSHRRAITPTDGIPPAMTIGSALAWLAAPAGVSPDVAHEAGNPARLQIERDHQHLRGRLRAMRGFKAIARVRVLCPCHRRRAPRTHSGPICQRDSLVEVPLASATPS
jgi:transposase-like protein